MPDPLPWERVRGETRKAYSAFVVYRDMGPGRSVRVAAVEHQKSMGTLLRWAHRWHWTERADAYDDHLEALRRQAAEEEMVAAVKDMKRRHLTIAKAMMNKVAGKLNEMNPADLSPKSLAAWVDIAVKIERLALDEPTANIDWRSAFRQQAEKVAAQMGLDVADVIAEAESILREHNTD